MNWIKGPIVTWFFFFVSPSDSVGGKKLGKVYYCTVCFFFWFLGGEGRRMGVIEFCYIYFLLEKCSR